jgi:hypothetical protein
MAALQVPFWESWDRRTKSGQSGKVEIAVDRLGSIWNCLNLRALDLRNGLRQINKALSGTVSPARPRV